MRTKPHSPVNVTAPASQMIFNFLFLQVEDVTLTLEPEPYSLTPSPLREEGPSTRGSSPGLPAQTAESIAERIPFDVTPCVVQSLEEKDEEGEEGSIVIVATN